MSRDRYEKPLGIDSNFGEALERFAQTGPKETSALMAGGNIEVQLVRNPYRFDQREVAKSLEKLHMKPQ